MGFSQVSDSEVSVRFDPSNSATNSIERPWHEAIDLALKSSPTATAAEPASRSCQPLKGDDGAGAGTAGGDARQREDERVHYYLKSDLTSELRADLDYAKADDHNHPGNENANENAREMQFPHVLDALFGLHGKKGEGGGEGFSARDAKVWVGSKGTVTSLHFDMAHAGNRVVIW